MEVYKYQTDAVKYVRDVITPKIGQNKPRETASRKNHWQSKEDDEKVVRGHSCAQVDLGDYEHKIEQVCLQNNMK